MDVRKLKINDLCEETRGETCPEIEAFTEQTKRLLESSGLSALQKQLAMIPQIDLPSQELLTQHLKASQALREMTATIALPDMDRIRETMVQFEPFSTSMLRDIKDLNACFTTRLERDMRASFRSVAPKVDYLQFGNVTPISTHLLNATNRVNESVVEATDNLDESIRTEFGVLLVQVKTLIDVNQKLFEHAVLNAKSDVKERNRNLKLTIWLLVLSLAMVLEQLGGITTIGRWLTQLMHWLRQVP